VNKEEAQGLIEEIKRDDGIDDNYQYCITAEGFVDWLYEHEFMIVSESAFYGEFETDEEDDGFIGSKKPPLSPD